MDPYAVTSQDAMVPVKAPAENFLEALVDVPLEGVPVQYKLAAQRALMIPEIVALIGFYLPLFGRYVQDHHHRFVDFWDPIPLLRGGTVCRMWHRILTSVLWHTYDLAIMDKRVPYDVLACNIEHVRTLSLLNIKHKKYAALWDALTKHKHIDRLEIHEAVFPVKKLIGPNTYTLAHLKLSGNCTRMHPFLMIFLERQVHLKSLELTRFKFTASDWKRIITNKPHLRKLTIGKQCEYLDFKSFGDEEDMRRESLTVKEMMNTRRVQDSMMMDVDRAPSSGAGVGHKRKSYSRNIDTGIVMKRRRPNRTILVNTPLPDDKNFGILPITHLVMQDNQLLLPFQQVILEASPDLEQLEICYTRKADGGRVATLVRDNCRNIRRLILRSARQPWTLAMIEGMPQSVEELIMHTGQLDLQMTAAIKDRAKILKRLDLDLGQRTRGRRRLACILSILRGCTELREFFYHNHAEDKVFREVMFKKRWNLPNLNKLYLHGITPRATYHGILQIPVPNGWRQRYRVQKNTCCSARSIEDVRKLGKTPKSPLFDVALLKHVKSLPQLLEVTITEAVYRKLVK
ncbi:hypothetical protein EC991_008526 [Linnemannia zychae]|nr:hypothetical protein EC991_008526 [Linnemannia zychae]